tara:strand:+ start:1448 stop:1606 length:159 start_codon:yes stop_codon:yes gene_type:complete
MTTESIFYIAVLVFALMIIGLFLMAREFLHISEDPSAKKDAESMDKASAGQH